MSKEADQVLSDLVAAIENFRQERDEDRKHRQEDTISSS